MPKTLTYDQVAEYFDEKKLLRKPDKNLIGEYARLMKDGSKFPPLVLGTYPGGKMFIDGAHRFKALGENNTKKVDVEIVDYPTLADALADQLTRNLGRGAEVEVEDRDNRIRQLNKEFKWSVRDIAKVINLHYSSVSRILSGKQKAGKPGNYGTAKKQPPIVPARPAQFFRVAQQVAATLANTTAREAVLGSALSGGLEPKDRPKIIEALQQAGQNLLKLAKQLQSATAHSQAA